MTTPGSGRGSRRSSKSGAQTPSLPARTAPVQRRRRMDIQRTKWRLRARGALEKYFRTHSAPRAALTVILSATGLIGFLITYGLLHFGIHHMWIRYRSEERRVGKECR